MRIHSKYQAGGTLIGLVIGLIIGLLVAMQIAMTMLKTPLPFVDKLNRQSQPAGDIGDPNKNLGGGGRERREPAPDEGAPVDAATEAAPPAAVNKTPVFVEADTLDSGNPPAPMAERAQIEKPAPASTAGPAPDAATGEEKFTYYLQAGAFREQADAENTKGKLAMMGLGASIVERRSELGTLYRVRIGPFTEEAMNRARTRLADNGVDAAVVRLPK